eukprot:m.165226 g.165226  ORF g.165226 m.165226 type:complete len:81 (-) comp13435_c1_seq1:2268-2510(-)
MRRREENRKKLSSIMSKWRWNERQKKLRDSSSDGNTTNPPSVEVITVKSPFKVTGTYTLDESRPESDTDSETNLVGDDDV